MTAQSYTTLAAPSVWQWGGGPGTLAIENLSATGQSVTILVELTSGPSESVSLAGPNDRLDYPLDGVRTVSLSASSYPAPVLFVMSSVSGLSLATASIVSGQATLRTYSFIGASIAVGVTKIASIVPGTFYTRIVASAIIASIKDTTIGASDARAQIALVSPTTVLVNPGVIVKSGMNTRDNTILHPQPLDVAALYAPTPLAPTIDLDILLAGVNAYPVGGVDVIGWLVVASL